MRDILRDESLFAQALVELTCKARVSVMLLPAAEQLPPALACMLV
jgi:hypothetical protein